MNKNNFNYAWCALVLLAACQSKKVQTAAAVSASPSPGAMVVAKTTAQKDAVAPARNMKSFDVITTGDHSIEYKVSPNNADAPTAYTIEVRKIGGADLQFKLEVKSTDTDLFQAIDSVFLGKVQIIEDKSADDEDTYKQTTTIAYDQYVGDAKTVAYPTLKGQEDLLVDLYNYIYQNKGAPVAVEVSKGSEQKYAEVAVETAGGGDMGFSIKPSDKYEGAFTVLVSHNQFKKLDHSFEVDQAAGSAYIAISDLFNGKVKLTLKSEVKPNDAPSGSWTSVTLTDKAGAKTENVLADQDGQKSLQEIRSLIEKALGGKSDEATANVMQRDSSKPAILAPVKQDCHTVNLAGVWSSDAVFGNDVRHIMMSIEANGGSADALTFKGVDSMMANNETGTAKRDFNTTYKYQPSSCIIEKSVDAKEAKRYKIIYVGNVQPQYVKIVSCEDQACTNYDDQPSFTNMALLKREK